MDTFGEWLRQQRSQRHLTREQLADRIGCSVALLRKIEDNERRPSTQIAELLANCLNISPAERATFVSVARGELGIDRLPSAMSASANATVSLTATPPRINLPVLPTPLIGRQREVAELSRLLSDGQCRLLTLVGPGGIGKTRLAIETAAHTQDCFADGVYFVSFTSVNTMRLIVPMIADAIGFAFQSASAADPRTQLFDYLQAKQVLLLLDNLEQLLAEPGIELLAELLAHTPQVKVLATSREALGLHDEWVFEVQGLPIPESSATVEGAQNTSVELFLQCARRAHVRFHATAADYPAIVRICQLVEGMPLAIELAAVWVRTLTCDAIAQEIECDLDFLRGTARDLPARHRSLRAVFDHSWQLLSEEEQSVLRRLSVFRGGFRREAVEAVASATLTTLATLVTKSFIRRSDASRYDLHELIRQFAAEQLDNYPIEQSAAQADHGRYHLTFFRQADERLRSAAQQAALVDLTAEMDNFRAAWDWAVTQGEFALIEQTLRTFAMYYDTRGWFQEGFDLLGRTAATLETANPPVVSGRAEQVALGHLLTCQGLFAFRLAQHEQAQALLERGLGILRPLSEPRVLVEALTFLGLVSVVMGNFARADDLFGEGLAVATTIGDRWFAALCLTLQLDLTHVLGKPDVAHAQLQTGVAEWRAIGDPRFTALALNSLGLSALTLGRYAEARTALEESVALNWLVGDRSGAGSAYRSLGDVAQAQGEHQLAVEMFRQSLAIFSELGTHQAGARALAELGNSIFALGNDAEAECVWRESLRIATETHSLPITTSALAGLARLYAKRGHVEQALALLLIVVRHPGSTQETRRRAEQLQHEVEAHLTRLQIEAAQARIQAKSFETLVEEILKQA